MNSYPRKTLSLVSRPAKVVTSKTGLTGVSSASYQMDNYQGDNWAMDNSSYPDRSKPRYHKRPNPGQHSHQNQGQYQDDQSGNKIRRGPGRRLAKEKRVRGMDPALMQKYATLSPALQEKVNATIEIYYQQHMAKVYRGQVAESDDADDHFEEDVVYDADQVPVQE